MKFLRSLSGYGWSFLFMSLSTPILILCAMPELWWYAAVLFVACIALLIVSD